MDSFEQASEIKCPKLVTKYQSDSKAEFTGSPSETESDSDSTEGTEGEDKGSFVKAKAVKMSHKKHSLAKFPKYLLSFIRYSTLKSS